MSLVSQAELEEKTEYSRASDIVKWLDNHGVKYWTAKGGKIFTTTEAINSALLSKDNTDIEFA